MSYRSRVVSIDAKGIIVKDLFYRPLEVFEANGELVPGGFSVVERYDHTVEMIRKVTRHVVNVRRRPKQPASAMYFEKSSGRFLG